MLRTAVFLITSFTLAGFQDDAEIAKWIADLGHDEVARREAAQAKLLKSGEKALPELRKAVASKDAEIAARVRTLILLIDRPERERQHDALERKRVLNLHSVDFKNARASDVLEKLKQLLNADFAGEIDPAARVTLTAKDETLRKILDEIEDQAKCTIRHQEGVWQVGSSKSPRKPRAYLPGTWLDLTRTPIEDGKVKGIRFKAKMEGMSSVFIDSWEAQGNDGHPRRVARCEPCGPYYAFVETGGEELRVRLKGRIQWNSHYEVQVANPEVAESFLIGSYVIQYEYPKLRVTSKEPLELYQFLYAELVGTYKGRVQDSSPPIRFEAPPRPEKMREPGRWCDCGPGPKPDPPVRNRIEFREYQGIYGSQPASAFESMKIMVRKPIQEPFDTEVVVPFE
jgi:hypothetical protein